MRILILTKNEYIRRYAELELFEHTLTDEFNTNPDAVIYDREYGMLPKELDCPVIPLTRGEGEGYKIPMPLGTLANLLASPAANTPRLTVAKNDNYATLDGKRIRLTALEHSLLSLLVSGGGDYVSRAVISEKVWQGAADGLINIYIHYLREKLEGGGERIILSSRKLGYKINEKFIKGASE